ncbi:MAG: hypothetical protein A3F11_04200 [Gammaproteobacteria bacterium RIFCSPHIGHO2_12_FULL_37_14]|nr:MAG: hypothetical protein A3F11_04200 [Gammaproteobacteria bacterium RIFCSPHIGHO2_12_FULL_37_14]
MSKTDIDTFNNLLLNFPYISNNTLLTAQKLSALTETDAYQYIASYLRNLADIAENELLFDRVMNLIFLYLENKKTDLNGDEIAFNTFSTKSLRKLAQTKLYIHVSDKDDNDNNNVPSPRMYGESEDISLPKFIAFMDAICQFELSEKFFENNGTLDLLISLDYLYFSDQNGVRLINQLTEIEFTEDEDENDFIENSHSYNFTLNLSDNIIIYNAIMHEIMISKNHYLQDMFTAIAGRKLGNNISKWRKVLCYMQVFDIEVNSISDYEIILNLHNEWLEDCKDEKIAKLNRKLFTPLGLRYALQHIRPSYFRDDDIRIINHIIEKLSAQSTPSAWESIQKYFTHSEFEFNKLLTRYDYIRNALHHHRLDMDQLITEPDLILLLDDIYFENESILKILPLFTLHENNYTKNHIIRNIWRLNIEVDNDYVQLLNAALNKLEYGMTICELSDEWLSKKGLQKIIKFSSKYLTPLGIRIINKLTPEIDDQLIRDMNACDDHTSLLTYLNTQLEANLNIIELAQRHTMRIKKIDEAILQLKKYTTIVPADKRKNNVDSMLNDSCPHSLQLPISMYDEDAIIYIKSRSNPLSFLELNEKLRIIIHPEKNQRDAIINLQGAKSCLNKPYPFLGRNLEAADIVELSDSTIDLDYLNRKLNLINRNHSEENTAVPANEQISWLSELKSSQQLVKIPQAFFACERLLLLTQLDPSFINKPFLLNYLDKVSPSITTLEHIHLLNRSIIDLENSLNSIDQLEDIIEKIPSAFLLIENITLLLSLHKHYLSAVNINYLCNVTDRVIDNTHITKLNYLAEHNIFPSLSANQFKKMPVEWLANKHIIRVLHILKPETLNDLVLNGPYSFALQSIRNAIFIFEHNIDGIKSDELNILLQNYKVNSEYPILLTMLHNYTSFDSHVFLIPANKALYHDIYRVYSLHLEQLFESNFFRDLRVKVKQDLLERMNANVQNTLEQMSTAYKQELEIFKQRMAHYAKTHFNLDTHEQLTTQWTFAKNVHLKAYLALNEGIVKNKNYAQLVAITEQYWKEIITSDTFSFSSELQLAVDSFIEKIRNIFKSWCYNLDFSRNQDIFTAACLLNDDFYRFLLSKSRSYHFAENYSHTYFQVLESYRPQELFDLINDDQMNLIYQKFRISLKNHATPKNESNPKIINNSTKQSNLLSFLNIKKNSIAKIPRRIDSPRAYQLQDPDIHVGIALLRNQLKAQQILDHIIYQRPEMINAHSKNYFTNSQPPTHHAIIFMPFGFIVQNEKNKSCNVIDMICEYSINNRESMCAGIFNINLNHNILILLYTPTQSATQIIIIDPAYPSPDKSNTLSLIKEIFNHLLTGKCKFIDIDIIQQFNDSDCGIACLQNISDIIHHGAITIENFEFVIRRDKFKLDACRHIGTENDFVSLAATTRSEWEDIFAKQTACYINYNDGKADEFISPYSFEKNKTLQSLTNNLENLVSDIIACFRESHGKIIYQFFDDHPTIPNQIPDEMSQKVALFIENDKLCHHYFDILTQINAITIDYPSERIVFNELTLKNNLLKQIQYIYCDKHYEQLDEKFIHFLNGKVHPKKNQLSELFHEFIENNEDILQLIDFFVSHNHNYFEHLKPKAEEYIDKLFHTNRWSTIYHFNDFPIRHFFHENPLNNKPVDAAKNHPSVPAIEKGSRNDKLKNVLIQNLEEIISALSYCQPTEALWGFFSDHKQLMDTIDDCIAWRNWLENATDYTQICQQQLFIRQQLAKKITSTLSANPQSASNLIRAHLARFPLIPDEVIGEIKPYDYTLHHGISYNHEVQLP